MKQYEKSCLLPSAYHQPGQICVSENLSHLASEIRARREVSAEEALLIALNALLVEEFGTRDMKQNRLARLIEEAYAQEVRLEGNLMPAFTTNLVALSARLKPLWEAFVALPLAGLTKKTPGADENLPPSPGNQALP